MSLTRVSPALFATSNNITSVTVGGSANTVSLTFDSNGVITGASNNALSVANTQITGNITSSQIAPDQTFYGNVSVTGTSTLTGNVGIGTASPSVKLHVSTSSAGTAEPLWLNNSQAVGANVGSRLVFTGTSSNNGLAAIDGAFAGATTADGGYMAFNTRAVTSGTLTERMRIDASGNLLVGTTSIPSASVGGARIQGGQANAFFSSSAQTTGGYNHINFFNPNGNIGSISTSSSTTTYSTSSDYRLKNTIAPMTGALDKVALLKPVTYKWNADGSDGQGFIAHELDAVVPGCVTGEKDAVDAEGKPQYQGIDTSFLVATLTAAIQELKAIVDAQAARIAALEIK